MSHFKVECRRHAKLGCEEKGPTEEALTCKSHITQGIHSILPNAGPVCKSEPVIEPAENDPSDPLINASDIEAVE